MRVTVLPVPYCQKIWWNFFFKLFHLKVSISLWTSEWKFHSICKIFIDPLPMWWCLYNLPLIIGPDWEFSDNVVCCCQTLQLGLSAFLHRNSAVIPMSSSDQCLHSGLWPLLCVPQNLVSFCILKRSQNISNNVSSFFLTFCSPPELEFYSSPLFFSCYTCCSISSCEICSGSSCK